MKLYLLYSPKKECYMGIDFSSNAEGDFCNDVEVRLSRGFTGAPLWASPDKELALKIAKNGPTEWFNADIESPNWVQRYYGDLRVVDAQTEEFVD